MKEKELELLKHLRNNSRRSLVRISKEINVPVSTLFDMLKRLESNIITKHVSLLDFSKLGYNIKINFAIKSKQKRELKDFLLNHSNVNTLSSSINDCDFYAECIFKEMKDMIDFKEKVESFDSKVEENFVIEELKKEGFQVN